MDITKPPTDYLEAIDRQLEILEEERKRMEETFGFGRINQAESIVALKQKEKSIAQPKKYTEKGMSAD